MCDLNMGVMNLNEEVEKMFYYAGSSKAIRMPTKGRSTRPLDRVSSRVGRASRQNVSSSFLYSARQSEPLFWSSGFSDAPRMLFLTLKVLGAVLLSFIHSFNVLNVG